MAATNAGDEVLERYRRSVVTLMGCLHGVATIAKGTDHEIVDNLGVMLAVLPPHRPETVDRVDHVRILLSTYMTAHPDDRDEQRDLLHTKLEEATG